MESRRDLPGLSDGDEVIMNRILVLSGLFLAMGCVKKEPQKSAVRELRSVDWFRKGEDHFYFAYEDTGVRIDPDYPEIDGHDSLFGVGCKGEDPSNPSLYQRTKLSEFMPPDNPTSKGCEILIGDREERLRIINSSFNSARGNAKAVANQWKLVLGACANASISSFVIAQSFVTSGLPLAGWLATFGASQIAQISAVHSFTGWLFCHSNFTLGNRMVGDYQMQENRSLLYETMMMAQRLADKRLAQSPQAHRYQELERAGQYRLASAIYNPFFVSAFNEGVTGVFEQGWGKSQKFFNAARSVQTELMDTLRNFKAPDGGDSTRAKMRQTDSRGE